MPVILLAGGIERDQRGSRPAGRSPHKNVKKAWIYDTMVFPRVVVENRL